MSKNLIERGHTFRKSGSLLKAIHIYRKAANKRTGLHDAGLYMQAFTYVLLDHKRKKELHQLGADLRKQQQDPLELANHCLKQIDDRQFNPQEIGLPLLTPYELKEIEQH
jgi:hypothetical protein